MDIKAFPALIVGVVVALVLAGATLPIWGDLSDSERTFYNDGVRMSPVGDGTLTIEYANDVITINGTTTYDYKARPITQGTIMFYETAHSARIGYLYVDSDGSYSRANVGRTDTLTMVYDGATKTCHIETLHNGTEYTSDHTYTEEVYYIDPNGAYVWAGEKPTPAYVPDDWNNFNTWSDGADYFYSIIGQDIAINYSAPPEGTTTTLNLVGVSGYSGLKEIETYTLNIPDSDPLACRGYILPYEVVGQATGTPSFVYVLMGVIPLLIIAGLVVGAVAWFINRKG